MKKMKLTNKTLNELADISRNILLVTLELKSEIKCGRYEKKICPVGTRAIGVVHDNEIDVYHETEYAEYDSNWIFDKTFKSTYKVVTK